MPATLIAILAIAGCSNKGGEGPGDHEANATMFAKQVAEAIDAASAGGASASQIAILKQAQEEGELTFDEAHTAVLATIDCVTGGGGTATYDEQTEPSGLIVPSFILEAKDDATLQRFEPLLDQCSSLESFWVNKVYQLQPDSQATRDAYLAKQAPAIRKCLEDNGIATDPAATPEELRSQALEAARDSDNAINCYH